MSALASGPARIGPNAISRTLEAIRECDGTEAARLVLGSGGLERYVHGVPAAMVPEADVIALYAALRAELGPRKTLLRAALAGRKTGDYLLAHRIPAAARVVFGMLPAALSARCLAAAITRHRWTFAGSANVRIHAGRPFAIELTGCPMCRGVSDVIPACAFYSAAFERLFRSLVHPQALVTETACSAMGAPACIFQVRW